VASVSSKTQRLIRHQDGPQRWGLIKIPTTKIRAFAISNKGIGDRVSEEIEQRSTKNRRISEN
jgi:hypothetical protein